VLLTASYANGGVNELTALKRGLAVAEQAGAPSLGRRVISAHLIVFRY
jgi:hypothetical protein